MKLDSEKDCIKWVRLHIPIVIKPIRKAKTVFVAPFTSANASDVVTKHLGEELFKQLKQNNDENNITK